MTPDGWVFGDIPIPGDWGTLQACELAADGDYSFVGGPFGSDLTTKHYVREGVPVIRGSNLNGRNRWMVEDGFVFVSEEKADQLRRNLAHPGDLVFTQRGTLGQVARIRPESVLPRFVLSQSQMKLAVDTAKADADFLYYFFASPLALREIERSTIATGLPHINLGILKRFSVPVPPLGEQRRIAAILSSVDDAIDATQAVIDQLSVVKLATMAELLTRGLPGRNTRFKQTEIGPVPEAWQVVGILDVADLRSGQVDPRVAPYGDWPLIAPNHVEGRSGRLMAIESARAQGAISGKYVFEAGDVVYSKIRPYLRKAWLADRVGLCSADMYPLRPRSGVDGHFLLLVVLGEAFSTYAESVSMRTGIPKLNREELAVFRMALPPMVEQREIGDADRILASRIEAEHETLAAMANMRTALMGVLLTGEVRVKPDEVAA